MILLLLLLLLEDYSTSYRNFIHGCSSEGKASMSNNNNVRANKITRIGKYHNNHHRPLQGPYPR
jgi:hypothetical protein